MIKISICEDDYRNFHFFSEEIKEYYTPGYTWQIEVSESELEWIKKTMEELEKVQEFLQNAKIIDI